MLELSVTGPRGVRIARRTDPLARPKAQFFAFAGRKLPEGGWQLVFCSADVGGQALERQLWLPAYSIALVEEPA